MTANPMVDIWPLSITRPDLGGQDQFEGWSFTRIIFRSGLSGLLSEPVLSSNSRLDKETYYRLPYQSFQVFNFVGQIKKSDGTPITTSAAFLGWFQKSIIYTV